MQSKRFLMVPVLSSAARMPLFLATIALAMRASSLRFIVRFSVHWSMAAKNTKSDVARWSGASGVPYRGPAQFAWFRNK